MNVNDVSELIAGLDSDRGNPPAVGCGVCYGRRLDFWNTFKASIRGELDIGAYLDIKCVVQDESYVIDVLEVGHAGTVLTLWRYR